MAGLALAVGLQDRGIDCHVFEAAAELRTSTATIISIATNGGGLGRQNELLSSLAWECLNIPKSFLSHLSRAFVFFPHLPLPPTLPPVILFYPPVPSRLRM